MAQSQTYFGLRRGSTKTQTFSILNGKQITKDRQIGGRNPRTPEMMTQRMVMATASAAYALMKQIVDHSFEGITYGAHTMSEFIRVNAAALRDNINAGTDNFAYNPYRDRAMYPGAYIMSRGTAAPITVVSAPEAGKVSIAISGDGATGIKIVYTKVNAGVALKMYQILNAFNCTVGDMATVCFIYGDRYSEGYSFGFVRFRFLKTDSLAITTENIRDYIKVESNLPFTLALTDAGLEYTVTPPGYDNNVAGAYCCIHSLKAANGWLRSNTAFEFEEGIDISPVAESALATYPLGPSYVLNGGDV